MLISIALKTIKDPGMDQLKALQYFSITAELGSFSAAAKQFDVPASSISRRIADLEASLGAQLLKRTTRNVALTEIGQQYLRQVKEILEQLEQSNQAVREYQATPTGRLKISSMVGFGEDILIPVLNEFSKKYPDIVLDVVFSDEVSKLARDDVDIAIRGGFAPDERVVAIHLMENHFIAAASKEYVAKYGRPITTKKLKHHKGLYYKTPVGTIPWLSEIDGQWQELGVAPALISNSGKWLLNKAVAGEGIVMLPRWKLQPYFDSEELIELSFDEPLNVTTNQEFGVYMLYQKLSYASPKVKAAVDFIAARLKR